MLYKHYRYKGSINLKAYDFKIQAFHISNINGGRTNLLGVRNILKARLVIQEAKQEIISKTKICKRKKAQEG